MLESLERNAASIGLADRVETRATDAEHLPFDDGTFDLVLGHAVLHHIPDLARAFGEFARVLVPGGTVLFAGEPSRYGDLLSRVPKRVASTLAPAWRRAMRARPAPVHPGHSPDTALEGIVDVHAFSPPELAHATQAAGFADVRVTGEELVANWFGWTNRTLEASAEPSDVPWAWRQYAYRGYLHLQQLDRRLFEGRLPAALFYNLMLSARKPAA
jgi:ubiquinone/menaquinone biosynthesis C-methylase UbiE